MPGLLIQNILRKHLWSVAKAGRFFFFKTITLAIS
jgi:hypothetical protein